VAYAVRIHRQGVRGLGEGSGSAEIRRGINVIYMNTTQEMKQKSGVRGKWHFSPGLT
jgi:hypothetical protein